MSRYLITGASGFVGRSLLKSLSSRGAEIFCLSRRSLAGDQTSARWIEAGLQNASIYAPYLERADYVIHLAGVINARCADEYVLTNVEGTRSLLEACRRAGASLRRFLYMSSVAVMGPRRDACLLKESDACAPESEYGKSKWLGEQLTLDYRTSLPVVILRPSFIYGRGDRRGLEFLSSLSRRDVSLWLTAVETFSVCHISDVVQACLLSLDKDVPNGDTFLLSDGETYTWDKMTAILRDALARILPPDRPSETAAVPEREDAGPKVVQAPGRSAKKQYWGCDISKARRYLGFQPRVAMKQGAEDTIRWYIQEGLWDPAPSGGAA
jgi:nucleoside-diphosphate-sugar epimerase